MLFIYILENNVEEIFAYLYIVNEQYSTGVLFIYISKNNLKTWYKHLIVNKQYLNNILSVYCLFCIMKNNVRKILIFEKGKNLLQLN